MITKEEIVLGRKQSNMQYRENFAELFGKLQAKLAVECEGKFDTDLEHLWYSYKLIPKK